MKSKQREPIKVRVYYPETAEGMQELQEAQGRQAVTALKILENQLGEEGLSIFIEYAKKKLNYKQ